jgi:DNA-binding CsgD family transcriptional regulator
VTVPWRATIWDSAVDLDTYLRSKAPHLDADGRVILEALGSGLTDESAAKRLGLSLRTYRRRVAELMAKLEADSRFQAGLRAGELGLPRQAHGDRIPLAVCTSDAPRTTEPVITPAPKDFRNRPRRVTRAARRTRYTISRRR